jgi:hypothetical protein
MINSSTRISVSRQRLRSAGAFGDGDAVEQLTGGQVEHGAVLLAGLVTQGAGQVGLPGACRPLQDDVLVLLQVAAHGEAGDQFGVHRAAGHGLDVGDVGVGLG